MRSIPVRMPRRYQSPIGASAGMKGEWAFNLNSLQSVDAFAYRMHCGVWSRTIPCCAARCCGSADAEDDQHCPSWCGALAAVVRRRRRNPAVNCHREYYFHFAATAVVAGGLRMAGNPSLPCREVHTMKMVTAFVHRRRVFSIVNGSGSRRFSLSDGR